MRLNEYENMNLKFDLSPAVQIFVPYINVPHSFILHGYITNLQYDQWQAPSLQASHAVVFRGLVLPPLHKRLLTQAQHSEPSKIWKVDLDLRTPLAGTVKNITAETVLDRAYVSFHHTFKISRFNAYQLTQSISLGREIAIFSSIFWLVTQSRLNIYQTLPSILSTLSVWRKPK